MPGPSATRVIDALSFSEPLQPVIPVKVLPPEVPVYVQVPVIPVPVNMPFDGSKPVVVSTVSEDVPPTRVTAVPFAGFPVQPVIPVNVLPPEVPV